ncbi:MAG: flagellar FliJ family protein [Butyrivibrio sp.]|jgi:flagellar FliJ protein|uniref:flagellar export protein FliJ n=1 Tax=Butyrivibrio sp. TaxID=28121 RepID=UPI001B5C8BDF|nr:flagellar FliJ family protein [Butyrivibrio sp.]MBP3280418.1 flagellar FliJ family protein [Butyrivibrio sp.]MBP3784115.1 flagellar FliJ family protein [Butyrivibrio sp.]
MARFVYRMQSVLNIKQQTENQTKMEFALAQNELNQQLDILDEYVKRKERYLREAEELRNEDSLKLQDILDNQYATAQMDVMIKQQSMVVKQYEERVEKVRVKLTRNVQERKMQESLRERAFAEFLEEQKQEEAKENDQRSSFTYAQRQKEE